MMSAVVIAIAHFPYQIKSMLTIRAVFANHLPRIGVFNGNSDSTGCVRGGREEYAIILSFFVYTFMVFLRNRPVFTLLASFAVYL